MLYATGQRERYSSFFYVTCSALLLFFALDQPYYFFWLSFLYLVPLFYCAQKDSNVSFAAGFLWGVVFFSLHLNGVTTLIIHECFGWFRFVFPFLLVFYCALHTGAWFWLASKTKKLFGWIFFTWIFIIWMPRGFLWASGKYIGYPLSFPLLPLIEHPNFLWLSKYVPLELLALCLVCFSMSVVFFFVKKEKKNLLFACFFLVPFLLGFCVVEEQRPIPQFFKTFGYIKPPIYKKNAHPLDVAQEIYYRMAKLQKKYPKIRYIVMPELSCRFALNQHQNIIDLWTANALHDDVGLVIGACQAKGCNTYNSLYFIKQGRVQSVHNKSLLMPFAEYVPTFYKKFTCCQTVFLSGNSGFTPGKSQKKFYFDEGFYCVNSICAETIFRKNCFAIKKSDNDFFLSSFHDALFTSHLAHLLHLWAKLEGFRQNKFSLFVGYSFACATKPTGETFKCLTISE